LIVTYIPPNFSPESRFEALMKRELETLSTELQSIMAGFGFTPLTAAPAKPRKYMVVLADGINWNPLALGRPHLVVYTGTAWVAV
jgi:hypothetical protein